MFSSSLCLLLLCIPSRCLGKRQQAWWEASDYVETEITSVVGQKWRGRGWWLCSFKSVGSGNGAQSPLVNRGCSGGNCCAQPVAWSACRSYGWPRAVFKARRRRSGRAFVFSCILLQVFTFTPYAELLTIRLSATAAAGRSYGHNSFRAIFLFAAVV